MNTEFLGNSVQQWLIALGATALTFLVVRVAVVRIARRVLEAVQNDRYLWDDVLQRTLKTTKSILVLVVAVFVGSTTVELPDRVRGITQSLAIIALLAQAGTWATAGLTEWLRLRSAERREEDPAEVMTMNIVGVMAKLVIWSFVLLLALENVGVDVTALVAGLGIGGIAVALAAQNILGDLFASLSIVLDKPFVLGDFIAVDNKIGGVEAIGLKTTRIRSLAGEQIVFANTDLLASRVQNYGRMFERRVVLRFGVTYQTPREQLQAIPGLIRNAIERHPANQVRFDRAHLDAYGDSAITYEAVYIVLDADYALHMDIKQEILLTVHEAFDERGIEYAYPTQTVFVERA